MSNRIIDKFLKDKNGNIVIMQKPNKAFIYAIIFYLLSKISLSGRISNTIQIAFYFAILYWAYLEIFFGVNYFRKSLGLMVGFFILFSLFASFVNSSIWVIGR